MSQTPRIAAVIFDLDGTLLDTLSDIASACNSALRDHDLPEHLVDSYRQFVGSGARVLVQVASPSGTSAEQIDALLARFEHHYGARGHASTRPYPGVEALLASLQARGVATAVLSNKPHPFTLECVAQHFPEHRFVRVLGQREGVARKPSAEGLLEILDAIQQPAERCLYVGDTEIDMRTGHNAGVPTAAVAWGFRDLVSLQMAGATHCVQRAEEIEALVFSKASIEETL